MPKWLRKSFVVLVTILTFGMITPSQAFLATDVNTGKSSKRDIIEAETGFLQDEQQQQFVNDKETLIRELVKVAEEQSYIKFGNRIKPVIEDEFKEVILPNIETAIEEFASRYPDESIKDLTVTEMPSGGDSEKIFNIFNRTNKQDIIRFHVRKDHPPQAGFWFNFHYHTYHDQFQSHHDLGSIYWDKNTPPKWMS
ncbi:YpjP family protein [Bacillus sp. 31A1R]|uniref:YpjP family protein n=1 Tax=Robertmurraya mangrovi TaxID=3098077 RepID=A0ABU5J162_9BACI|nr:YpjP family protein [Bacillus sp. 31A1R]MDZ5473149.1 YpjP family protein [Bacillus sp. 31A1R]